MGWVYIIVGWGWMVNELIIKFVLNFLVKVKLLYNREKSLNMVI